MNTDVSLKGREVVLYARFSPRREGDACQSCDLQLEEMRKACAEAKATIVSEHQDKNKSGASLKRPGLWSAIDDLASGRLLVVYKLDRLYRGDEQLRALTNKKIRVAGGQVYSLQGEGTRSLKPEDKFIRGILEQAAEYERNLIAFRTAKGMARNKARNRRQTRPDQLPYGFKLDMTADPLPNANGRLVVHPLMVKDPLEQAVIASMVAMRQEGKTLREIANALTQAKIMTRCGRPWSHAAVDKVLRRVAALSAA